MRDMPALPDPLPDTIDPWPLWCQAMQQWEQHHGRAIVQVATDGTEEYKDVLRTILGDYHAWLNRPEWER